MEEDADSTATVHDRTFVTAASPGDARPRLTIVLDAFCHAVLGTIVTGAETPKGLPPV